MSEVMLTITNPDTSAVETIDLSLNENISMVFQFSSIAELETRGTFTRQFRVPATDRNVALFGALFDVNYSGNFSFHRKANAELSVATLPINRGHIQMRRVILQKGEFAEFELAYFSETPDLVRAIGTGKLSDLDYSALAHDISFADVTTGSTNWKYALSDRGQKWTETGEVNTRPVLSIHNPVYPSELTLMIRFRWLFDKILTNAGFTYSGSTLQASLDNIWMEYVNSKENQTGIPQQQYFFNAGIAADQPGFTANQNGVVVPSMAEAFDNNNDFASNTWTAPYSGWFKFKMWVTLDPFSFPDNALATLYLKRTDVLSVVTSNTFVVNGPNIVNHQMVVGPVFLGVGQTFQLHLGLSSQLNTLTVTLKSDANNNPGLGTGWTILEAGSPVAGEPMDIDLNAPDYLQIDFVKDVARMHNLAIIPDKNVPNRLNMVPIAEYLSAGSVKDWTGKMDLDKDVTLDPTTDIQKKRLNFTYKLGSDVASKLYEKNGRVYGNYIVDGYTSGQTNDFIQGELKVELGLSSTPGSYIANTSIIIPKFVNETGEFQDPGPRAFYITGQTNIAIYNEVAVAGEIAAINLISHYSVNNPSVGDNDLNWAPEDPLHDITANPFNNLFNRFYRSYLNEIYSDQARILEAFFAFEITDILNFNFNDKFWIKDAYWRVLEITDYGVGLNESTKVKLIKILGDARDCAVTPVDADNDGIIEWEDFDGDPASGTEQCCLRYGYTWNPDDNTCQGISGNQSPSSAIGKVIGAIDSVLPSTLGSNISHGLEHAVIAGIGHNIGARNSFSLIVGENLTLEDNAGTTTIIGTNGLANIQGFHIGGGFPGTVRNSSGQGTAQAGIIILSASDSFPSDGDEILLSVIGEDGNHINLPENTTATVRLDVVIHQYDVITGETTGYHHGTFQLLLTKTAGVAATEDVETIYQFGDFGTIDVVVDTTTNTLEHRIKITSTGGSYPISDLRITSSFNYTQTRNPLPTGEGRAYSSGYSAGYS